MSTDTREALAALPPLPDPAYNFWRTSDGPTAYTADQMRAYARAALATQPAQPMELEQRLTEIAKTLPPMTTLGWNDGGMCEPDEAIKGYTKKQVLEILAAHLPATQPAQPSAQGEAVAWLVEWKAHGHEPRWWGFNHTPGKNATWCSDASNAIRFARKEDAERMRLHIIAVAGLTGMHSYERSISVTEHMWEGPCQNI